MTAIPFPPHESRTRGGVRHGRFLELHLYLGSRCNRRCDFCTVSGGPEGWYSPLSEAALAAVLRWTAPDGNLKVYGGEPLLDMAALLDAVRRLRNGGFAGWMTVFSNGVLAERALELLDADTATEVVLNHSILCGTGAPALPARSRRQMERYAAANPGRIFASHPDLLPLGRAASGGAVFAGSPRFGDCCPRCAPVLTARGRLHACPFAVEYDLPHYDLGGLRAGAADAIRRHGEFLNRIELSVEPRARLRSVSPCTICTAAGSLLTIGTQA